MSIRRNSVTRGHLRSADRRQRDPHRRCGVPLGRACAVDRSQAWRRTLAGTTALTTAAVCGWLMAADPAFATPTGGVVTEGQADITYGDTSVTIHQHTDRVIIEWQSFDVGAGETVHFEQPHELAAALNIIFGGPSSIAGAITSTGQVFLSNPEGITFEQTAQVDVQSIVATTLSIAERTDFMAGGFVEFELGTGSETATVVNYGSINASGLAALVAPGVRNSGAIVANVAILGAGEGFALDYYGDGLVNFAITNPVTELPRAADGTPVEALVVNDGTILSDGGQVILTADAAADVIDTVINLDHVEFGDGIVNRGGQVVILGGETGTVTVADTIDVSGEGPGNQGGTVHVLGEQLVLDLGAEIDASGPGGGGTVLVGGAERGGPLAAGGHIAYAELEPGAGGGTSIEIDTTTPFATESYIPTADITYVEAGSEIIARGTAEEAEGGTVVVWGTEEVQFHGTIDTGLSGFVEVSTRVAGTIAGSVTTGHMLVDPGDVCISAGNTGGCSAAATILGFGTITDILNSGGVFELNTNSFDNAGTGRVVFGSPSVVFTINNTSDTVGTFEIHAADTIDTNQVVIQNNGPNGTNFEWYAGSSETSNPVASADIILGPQLLDTGGGYAYFEAADDILISDPLITDGGDATFIANGGAGGAVITIGAEGNPDDDHIDTTDGNGNAGAVTFVTDTFVIDPNAATRPDLNLNAVIDAAGIGGIVTFRPTTPGRAINLGTVVAGSLSITAADIDRIAAEVLRFGDATSGNITISDALAPTQVTNLSLVTGGQIVDGNAAGADVTATGLALQAASSDGLETAITNLAFDVTGGVDVSNTGGLTIAAVDGVTASSATNGSVNLTAASPVTIAADVSASGNVTATAAESGAVDTDNVTVNTGVTVQSTGGNVTLQAGDDVDVGAGATVSANGTLTLTAGFGDTDGDGGLTIGSAAVLSGPTINLTAINDILMSVINASSSSVNVTSTAGAVSLVDTSGTYQFGSLSVTGSSINLGATISSTGAQTYESPVVLTGDTVLTSTGDANITFNSTINGLFGLTVNTGGTTAFNGAIGLGGDRLGSLTTDAGGTTAFNISVDDNQSEVSIQGDAVFGDDVTIAGGNQRWNLFGNTTFDGTVNGTVDIILQVRNPLTFNGAVTLGGLQVTTGGLTAINGGSVTTTRFGMRFLDVVLGADTVFTVEPATRELRFRGTVDGGFALTANVGGATEFEGVVGGTTPLASLTTDAPGTTLLEGGAITLSGNTATFNDAVVLTVDTVITDAGAVTFNNTVDGAFGLTVDAGGNVTFGGAVGGTTPLASLDVGSDGEIIVNAAITTANGNVTFDADVMAIAASINAGTGIVALRPRTAGGTISLGAEVVGSLSLTDAELDLITADILRIGSAAAGSITFNGAVSPALTNTLSLITGDAIVDANAAGADLQVTNLALQAVNGIGAADGIDLGVGTVAAANSTSGTIRVLQLTGLGDLTVGTVDGVVGVSNQATTGISQTRIQTEASGLIVNSAVFSAAAPLLLSTGGNNLLDNNATISTTTGFGIDLQSSRMALEGGTVTAGNNGRVRVTPLFVGARVDLGSTSDAGSGLELSDAELDTITAGTLQIGLPGLRDITITDQITLANVSTLDLRTSGAVVDGTPTEQTDLTVQNLSIRSGNGVTGLDTAVTNLAFANTDGAFDLTNTGALTITSVDGLTTSSNTGTTTDIASGDPLTFAVNTSSNGNAAFTAATITVNTGVAVDASPGGTLAFNATTVNLDGDLSAVAGGITGTATTVNVVGSAGGAEIQDAVDVAAAGATINVGDGTFAGGIVVDKAVTLLGDGFTGTTTVTVADGTAGMTVPASGVTIDGFLFVGDGTPVDATGVVVDVSGGALTGILIGDADADNFGSRFTGLTTGLSVTDGGTGNAAVVEIGQGNVFDNNVDGLVFDGAGVDIDGDSLSNTAFGAHTGNFVELINGAEFDATTGTPTVIDATLVDFNGLDISDPANALAVEQQIVHYLDTGDVGLLRLSTDGPIAAADSIQLAVNAAGLLGGPQTVVVGAGTFGGSVEVWVDDLTLQGQGATTIIDTDDVDPFANNGDVDNGFQVAAISALSGGGDVSGVTIDGFAFDTVTTTGQNIGVELGETGLSEASGATVQNSSFTDLLDGIVTNGVTATTTISNVTMTGIASNGIDFLPALGVDDTIVIENSSIASDDDAVRFSSTLTGTAVTITGNTIEGATDGLEFTGAIGGGSDVTIAGNQRIEGLATFLDEDDLGDGIVFRGAVSGAATSILIDDNTLIRGADRGINFASAGTGGPATVTDASLTISRNDEIRGTGIDGILFNANITNATIVIGGASAADGNDLIIGRDDGLDIENVNGGSFTIANNTRIEGETFNGIEFEGEISNGAEVTVLDNTTIVGADNGVILLDTVTDSVVAIARNTTIQGLAIDGISISDATNSTIVIAENDNILGDGFDGIFFDSTLTDTEVIIGEATATIGGTDVAFGANGNIIGAENGVNVGAISGGSFTVANNTLIQGGTGNGIVANQITTDALFAVVGNTTIEGAVSGINFEASASDSALTIADNTTIRGIGLDGITIRGASNSIIVIAQNEQILGDGFGGIFVVDDLIDTEVIIGQATATVDGTPTAFGGNGDIVGVVSGVTVDGITGGSVTVANNDLIRGEAAFGIFADDITADALFAVVGNTEIRGGDGAGAIDFDNGISIASADMSTIAIAGNDGIFGDGNDGIVVTGNLTDTDFIIGPATVQVDGVDVDFLGNGQIIGAEDGINVGAISGGTFTVAENTRIEGTTGSGIEFDDTVSDNAVLSVTGNTEIVAGEEGVEFDTTVTDSTVTISDNPSIVAGIHGVAFLDAVAGSTIDILTNVIDAGNTDGLNGDGIHFGDTVTDTDVTIGGTDVTGNDIDVGNAAPGNATGHDGIYFGGELGGETQVLISFNDIDVLTTTGSGATSFGDMGIRFDGFVNVGPVGTSGVEISDNQISAGEGKEDRGIVFWNGIGGDSQVSILRNTVEAGDDGIGVFDVETGAIGDGAGARQSVRGNAVLLIEDNTIGTAAARVGLANNDDGVGIDFEGVRGQSQVRIIDNSIFSNRNGIEFSGVITTGFAGIGLEIAQNANINSLTENGIAFVRAIGGDAVVSIDLNGTATQDGVDYDGTAEVELAGFAVTGSITGGGGSGISFLDILSNAAVTVSRNMITGNSGNGISVTGGIASTETTEVHNNFILGNGGNGIAFAGDVASRTEVFQNFIANNGGNGVLVDTAASLSPDSLFVQVNFLPGAGFDNGNGGFGFNQLGVGSPDLEGNWWGTPDGTLFPTNFAQSINGVASGDLPSLIVLATGDDDANISPPFGNTAFEFFAFQPFEIGAPLEPDAVIFPTDTETLLDQIRGPESQTDRPGGAVFFTNELGEPFQTTVFSDSFSIGELTGPGGLQPAAGGGQGPVNLGDLQPAAGPGSEEAQAEDTCVAAYLGDFWGADAACQ